MSQTAYKADCRQLSAFRTPPLKACFPRPTIFGRFPVLRASIAPDGWNGVACGQAAFMPSALRADTCSTFDKTRHMQRCKVRRSISRGLEQRLHSVAILRPWASRSAFYNA